MKKLNSTSAILAAIATVTGCVPMEPIEPVVHDSADDEICRMESPIGSHVKEEDCNPAASIGDSDRDIENIFGDIMLEPMQDLPEVAEGKCGNQ